MIVCDDFNKRIIGSKLLNYIEGSAGLCRDINTPIMKRESEAVDIGRGEGDGMKYHGKEDSENLT